MINEMVKYIQENYDEIDDYLGDGLDLETMISSPQHYGMGMPELGTELFGAVENLVGRAGEANPINDMNRDDLLKFDWTAVARQLVKEMV